MYFKGIESKSKGEIDLYTSSLPMSSVVLFIDLFHLHQCCLSFCLLDDLFLEV